MLVNVHAHADQVREFVQTQRSGVQIQLAEEAVLLGSAGTLAANRKFVTGGREFLVLYGDVLTNTDLRELVHAHRKRKAIAMLGAYEVPDPGRCGILSVNGDAIIQSFVEKPEQPASNLAFAGVMVAGQELFDFISEKKPADIAFDVLPKLVGRMRALKLTDYLLDIGTMENYTAAQASWPGLWSPQQKQVVTTG